MKAQTIFCLLFTSLILCGFILKIVPQKNKTDKPKDVTYTFQKNVFPLLQANCNPCHFSGGKVYGKLPFDDYKTVVSLGKKLNTRLKQNKQQAIINEWIKGGARE